MANTTPVLRPLTLMLMVLTLACGCATPSRQNHPGDLTARNDYTQQIDHRKANPKEPVAKLEITTETPVFDQYQIATGDVLDVTYILQRQHRDRYEITLYHTIAVNFVNTPNLNQTQDVLPDGTISLPYLGAYEVVGKTTEVLARELNRAYADVLRDPDIYVKIENFNARVEQVRNDLHTSSRGLSKLLTVRPDGVATFPYIGDYQVEGKTIDAVQRQIQPAYTAFMRGLKVDIFMHEQTGTNLYVMGEVAEPGAIQVSRPTNVLQAIARAGGYTREGQTENVFVFRREGQQLNAHRFDIKHMARYGAQASNFYLQPEDVLVVPRSKISSLAQLMREISDISLFQGWDVNP